MPFPKVGMRVRWRLSLKEMAHPELAAHVVYTIVECRAADWQNGLVGVVDDADGSIIHASIQLFEKVADPPHKPERETA